MPQTAATAVAKFIVWQLGAVLDCPALKRSQSRSRWSPSESHRIDWTWTSNFYQFWRQRNGRISWLVVRYSTRTWNVDKSKPVNKAAENSLTSISGSAPMWGFYHLPERSPAQCKAFHPLLPVRLERVYERRLYKMHAEGHHLENPYRAIPGWRPEVSECSTRVLPITANESNRLRR